MICRRNRFALRCISLIVVYAVFFFFKQKTAYGMRISDWSSDVCSSDLDEPDDRVDAQPVERGNDKPRAAEHNQSFTKAGGVDRQGHWFILAAARAKCQRGGMTIARSRARLPMVVAARRCRARGGVRPDGVRSLPEGLRAGARVHQI